MEFLILAEFMYNCSRHANNRLIFYEALYDYLHEIESTICQNLKKEAFSMLKLYEIKSYTKRSRKQIDKNTNVISKEHELTL